MSSEMPGQDAERRTSTREPMRRPVVFAGVRGEGLLRQGVAVDISASGLSIQTTQPDLVGRHLEIELHPDTAPEQGEVIMVRGEVVWTRPLPAKGDHVMGVRFLQSFPATDLTGATYRPASSEESASLAASIQRRLAAMEPATRVEISGAARQRNAAARTAPAGGGAPRTRRYTRLLWLSLLLLLVALVVSTGTLALLWGLGLFERAAAPPPVAEVPVSTAQTLDSQPGPSHAVSDRVESVLEGGAAYQMQRGNLYMIQGRFPAAVQAFQRAQRKPGIAPVDRFVAQLGEAQALAGDGRTGEALALLALPFEGIDGIPEPWRALKEEFYAALVEAPESGPARMPLVNAFAFERAPERGGGPPESPSPGAMRIQIDTARHLLNVLENNSIKAVYPIGLGAHDKTPEGQFTIVNKIENPEWYNKGDVVPAGDPENQLGSRWLGLGDESGPTPLGIHATEDLDSIGSNQSRGCIRMRPGDVEALFQMVDVGTPVSIRAL